MIAKGREAANSPKLDAEERSTLEDEMQQSLALHGRLQAAMALHSDWQRMHERLQLIDGDLGRQSDKSALSAMADHLAPIARLTTRADNLWTDATRPTAATGLAARLTDHCTRIQAKADSETYLAMRNVFDELFFQLDIETLDIVKQAERRANALEEQLRKRGEQDQ